MFLMIWSFQPTSDFEANLNLRTTTEIISTIFPRVKNKCLSGLVRLMLRTLERKSSKWKVTGGRRLEKSNFSHAAPITTEILLWPWLWRETLICICSTTKFILSALQNSSPSTNAICWFSHIVSPLGELIERIARDLKWNFSMSQSAILVNSASNKARRYQTITRTWLKSLLITSKL
jgi:hypothetical protein